jgi:hypothetical protein
MYAQEIRLAPIVSGKRMCTLDDPVHVLCDMIEEPFSVSGFDTPENLPDAGDGHGGVRCRVVRSTFLNPPGLSLRDSPPALTLPFRALPRETALGRVQTQNKRSINKKGGWVRCRLRGTT